MGAGVVLLLVLVMILTMFTRDKVDIDDTMTGKVSEFNVGLDKDTFYIKPISIKTELGGYDTHLTMDIDKDNLLTLDNYGSFTSMSYSDKDKTAINELMITKDLPEGINIDGLKTNKISKKSSLVRVGDSIRELKDIGGGFIYRTLSAKNLNDKVATSEVDNIYKKMKNSKHTENRDVILHIDGIGDLKLSSLSIFKNNPGIFYGKDKVLRLYNYKDDVSYIWITHINNVLLMNTVGNLERTEFNNVYRDKDYTKQDAMGHRTYSVMTSKGMYTFKFNDKAPKGLEMELFKVLNIKKDDKKIELPFKLSDEVEVKK